MQIVISDEAGSTAKLGLTGKLDIAGAEVIAIPLATLAGGKKGVVIDMSGVTFLASIGIRHLVSATKTLARKGGKLVLVSPDGRGEGGAGNLRRDRPDADRRDRKRGLRTASAEPGASPFTLQPMPRSA